MTSRASRQPVLATVLAAAGAFATAIAAAVPSPAIAESAPTPAPAAAAPEKAILADFVEVTSRQVMRRDAALIELINMSSVTLEVSVGEAATTLKPDERMLAGVQPGAVPVKVIAQGVSTAPLEGDLQIEGGRHYELAFAYDHPPRLRADAATPTSTSDAAPGSADASGSAATSDPTREPVKAAPTREPRKGKVSVGRRRR